VIEQEVILLRAVSDHIGEMVNFEVMDIYGEDPHSYVMFKTMTHRRFFNILLVDFLSQTDKRGPIKKTSFLGGLIEICESPNFDKCKSIESLKTSAQGFKKWLETKVKISVWLSSLNEEAQLEVARYSFLKMTGDTSKHNYLRAIGVAEELSKTLEKSDIECDIEDALLALPDFHERFHTDIMTYHSSTIAEYLNNIRWGIYCYLKPEFNQSIEQSNDNLIGYRYKVPEFISSKYAKDCYWELMNQVRRSPYMRKFIVSEHFKGEY